MPQSHPHEDVCLLRVADSLSPFSGPNIPSLPAQISLSSEYSTVVKKVLIAIVIVIIVIEIIKDCSSENPQPLSPLHGVTLPIPEVGP